MNLPSRKDIRNAYGYAVFLRAAGPLDPRDRMLCDLGYEVQRLRNWICEEGNRTNTCVNSVLPEEVCEGCRCGKSNHI